MAHKNKKKAKRTKGCPKGKRGKACRRRRRGLGDYDSANAAMQARASASAVDAECHKNNLMRASAGLSPKPCAPSKAKVAKAKKKAKAKGCTPTKGRVCVDKTVAKIGSKLRRGCKKAPAPGTYTCTNSALKAQAAGKHVASGKRAPKGYKFVPFKTGTTANGSVKRGCKLYRTRIICKSRKAA